MPGLFCSAAFWLVRIAYCGRLGRGAEKNRAIKRFRNRAISNRDFISISINRTALIDIQDRALGAHYIRYKWCANELCTCALGSLIFLLEYSSVYSCSWIQRVFYNGCSCVLEKFVRISGVYVHYVTEEVLMASWIVNNNNLLLLN